MALLIVGGTMLIKIKSRSQLGVIKHLPIEVFNEAKRVVTILDENYNNYNVDGGYVLIAENADDLKRIIGYYFDYTSMIYEFAERIKCSSGDEYISILYLLGTEYSVTLIAPTYNVSKYIDIE